MYVYNSIITILSVKEKKKKDTNYSVYIYDD